MSILKVCVNRYLDTVYNDLDCLVSSVEVTWYKNGKIIACVTKKEDRKRLRLSSSEFNTFRRMFSLPWSEPKDNIFLLEMILPYLKFNSGSPAIPILQDLGFIDEINYIALPSDWK
jgi:hypothetical protein